MKGLRFTAVLFALVAGAFVTRHSSLVIPSSSQTLTERFNRAVALQRQGAHKEAEAEYRALLALAPNYAEAHANLGVVLMRMDRYEEAVTAYESALRLAPTLSRVRLNLGIAHYRKGEFEKAVADLRSFLENSPDTFQANQLIGLSLIELGRDSEAIEFLNQSLSDSPDDPAVLYALGLAHLRLNKPGLRTIIERLAAANGGLAASHLLRGQSFLVTSEYERAMAELESAAKLDSLLPRLQYSLGLGYFKLGRYREAREAFQAELSRTPKDFSTLYYLAYLSETEGDYRGARERLDRALSLEPESPEGNALLGKILVKQGQIVEALKPLELAVRKEPEDSEKRFLLARVYQQLGRRDDAAREFAEVQRLKALKLEKDRARTPKNDE